MEENQSKFRNEKKFILARKDIFFFIKELLEKGYLEIYNSRRINNVYFDDFNLNSKTENIEGYSKRTKYRVRWYGETFENSNKTFEFKIKKEDVNFKNFFDLGNIKFSNPIFLNDFESLFLSSNFKELNKSIINKHPVCFNSYKRKYFYHEKNNVRITVDDDIKFSSIKDQITKSEINLVVEIKYNSLINFSNYFHSNLILNKYSKYLKGVL